jgi:hypothetical protein
MGRDRQAVAGPRCRRTRVSSVKSPWKYLVGLTSRRNPARAEDLPVVPDRQTGAVGKETLRVQIVVGNALGSAAVALGNQSPATDLLATTAIPDSGLSLQSFAAVDEVQVEATEDAEEKLFEPVSALDQNRTRASSSAIPPTKLPKGVKKGGISTDAAPIC